MAGSEIAEAGVKAGLLVVKIRSGWGVNRPMPFGRISTAGRSREGVQSIFKNRVNMHVHGRGTYEDISWVTGRARRPQVGVKVGF